MDGANAWQRFRNVTLPGLRPVLLFVITTTDARLGEHVRPVVPDHPGAPGTETRTVVWFIVEEGLRNNDAGRAAAMSIVFALLLVVVSIANFRLFRYRRRD